MSDFCFLPSPAASSSSGKPLYQLTQVQQVVNGNSSTSESYTYDAVGNRLSSLNVASYTYNNSNEVASSADGYSYTYDANGNTLTKANSSGATTYGWDFENRLASVILPNGGGTVSFKSDPFGRRIYKSSANGTNIYFYDGQNVIEETDGSGNAVARYSQQLSTDDVLAMLRSGAMSFYNADDLGSITSISNAASALVQTYTFNAFGNQTAASGSLTNAFQYTGRDFDSETGLYYNRARYYDQTLGRFVSEDPIGFKGGINFYKYAENDPVVFKDPTGKDTYVCTAPLHAPGPFFGPLLYYSLPFVGIPIYHEYLCVSDGKNMACGGRDQTGNWHGGPGRRSNDTAGERGGGCSVVNDQQCVDKCVTKAINNPDRPNYDLTNRKNVGENCQKWADDTLESCVQQCIGKK